MERHGNKLETRGQGGGHPGVQRSVGQRGVDLSHCGEATLLEQLPFQASLELRAGAGGFLQEISEWSQLIIIVELSSDGEYSLTLAKKVLH